MNKCVTFTLIGKNKPGLVTNIFKKLYQNNININQSKMHSFNNNFVISANAEMHQKININDIINKYHNIKDLDKDLYKNNNYYQAKVKVNNANEPGIIHNTTQIISDLDINIDNLESYTTRAPMSSIQIFHLSSVINIDKNLDFFSLKDKIIDNLEEKGYDCYIEQI